ncbi:MAG TPA: endolytic transglycosylase MltG, partial [Labilithrix sp.]
SSGTQERGQRRKRTKRVRKEKRTFWQKNGRAIAGALLILGAIFAAVASYVLVVYPSSEGTGTGRAVELAFDGTEGTGAVIEKLQGAGLLASPRTFAIYARLAGLKTAAGRHLLTDDATPGELVRRLERNGAHAKITIPEGWTRFDIARRLEAQQVASQSAFLDATADADLLRELAQDAESFEGFLFPATYDFPRDSDAREVVRRLHAEFERRWVLVEQNHRLGIAQLDASLGWGKKEIVTLASMVEKEAALDDERPIIASVFLNRMRDASFKKKLLQCDPTAGYGCLALKDKVPACAGYAGKITHAINFDPANTYSTYVREGLPPGPIGNPGVKSLQAVVAPASTKFLYFVARGEGRKHVFSETLDEHNAAVKDLKDLRERTSPQK